MKMKIFAAGIAAVTVGMLAPIPAMGVDKPSDSVSTSMTATPQDIIDDCTNRTRFRRSAAQCRPEPTLPPPPTCRNS